MFVSRSSSMFSSSGTSNEKSLEKSVKKKNTARTKAKAASGLNVQTYLGAENANFEEMPKYALNNHLRMFFASIRTVKGEELKKSTMYSAKLTDLQKKGKGSVVHKPKIAHHDMKKLMDPANVAFNVNTPCGLQNKVWFDIMYHLCRRGQENLREMKKTTFAVEVDSSGREYVR
ncbi:hypothetical protein MAR_004317 [Mya arenaria]|uniref:Uncharacterized protein n=1 Tax=Mya arenaria TaxID=6604 RepID=A0ABY7EW75_MYAAR|nr:hypothetical protein MAR_004317 [Mya arenaria]